MAAYGIPQERFSDNCRRDELGILGVGLLLIHAGVIAQGLVVSRALVR